jgi:hypothetical protein
VPLGSPSGPDNQASFGLGVYGIDRCNLSIDLSRSSCRNRAAPGLELRATGGDRLGLWITGPRKTELFAFARPSPLSGAQELSFTGKDWVTIGLIGAAVITVAILTIRVECDDYKIDPYTGQPSDPC